MAQILSEKPVANDCFGVIHHCIHRKN
jgi:hypothetical protein